MTTEPWAGGVCETCQRPMWKTHRVDGKLIYTRPPDAPKGWLKRARAGMCASCWTRRHRGTDGPATEPAAKRRAAFIEDYQFLRSHHLNDEEIAERMGIAPKTLRQYVRHSDIRVFTSDEQRTWDWIVKYSESGRSFTIDSLPYALESEDATAVHQRILSLAIRRGLIRNTGVRRVSKLDPTNPPILIYESMKEAA